MREYQPVDGGGADLGVGLVVKLDHGAGFTFARHFAFTSASIHGTSSNSRGDHDVAGGDGNRLGTVGDDLPDLDGVGSRGHIVDRFDDKLAVRSYGSLTDLIIVHVEQFDGHTSDAGTIHASFEAVGVVDSDRSRRRNNYRHATRGNSRGGETIDLLIDGKSVQSRLQNGSGDGKLAVLSARALGREGGVGVYLDGGTRSASSVHLTFVVQSQAGRGPRRRVRWRLDDGDGLGIDGGRAANVVDLLDRERVRANSQSVALNYKSSIGVDGGAAEFGGAFVQVDRSARLSLALDDRNVAIFESGFDPDRGRWRREGNRASVHGIRDTVHVFLSRRERVGPIGQIENLDLPRAVVCNRRRPNTGVGLVVNNENGSGCTFAHNNGVAAFEGSRSHRRWRHDHGVVGGSEIGFATGLVNDPNRQLVGTTVPPSRQKREATVGLNGNWITARLVIAQQKGVEARSAGSFDSGDVFSDVRRLNNWL